MADPIITGAQGAVSTLKSAQNVGKQLGGVVTDQQADMEKAVQDQHRQRMQAAARKAYEKSIEEFKAFEAYEKQKAHEKEVARIKAQAIAKYGTHAWNEIEALKLKLRKEKEEEENLMDKDRHKVQELFWWCMTVAALITYFFKLYK
jgi:predicted RNase H-like nuclease (RuvC/YqgF family)